MVDYFSLLLSHGILLLAFWRLALRDDLDAEPHREENPQVPEAESVPEPKKGQLRRA
jgi:hypothetical protein